MAIKTCIISKRGQEPPLPRPFGLPQNFSDLITKSLSEKNITGKARTKFITVIAQSIYRYKSYPTDEEYFQVVREMVKEWPFLDDGKGLVSLPSTID